MKTQRSTYLSERDSDLTVAPRAEFAYDLDQSHSAREDHLETSSARLSPPNAKPLRLQKSPRSAASWVERSGDRRVLCLRRALTRVQRGISGAEQ